jgi:hypothetical protein
LRTAEYNRPNNNVNIAGLCCGAKGRCASLRRFEKTAPVARFLRVCGELNSKLPEVDAAKISRFDRRREIFR